MAINTTYHPIASRLNGRSLAAPENGDKRSDVDRLAEVNKECQIDDRLYKTPRDLYCRMGAPAKLGMCGPFTRKVVQLVMKEELVKLKVGAGKGTSLAALIGCYEKEFEKKFEEEFPRRDGSIAVFSKVVKHLEKELVTLTAKKHLEEYKEQHPDQAEEMNQENPTPEIQELIDQVSRSELTAFQSANSEYYKAGVILELNERIEELNLHIFVEGGYSKSPLQDHTLDEKLKDYEGRDFSATLGLGLSNEGLTRLPLSIGKFTGLREINLSSNQLTVLPAAIGKLKSLESLDLKGNLLKALPAAIGEFTSLKTLTLTNNQLKELPETISSLKNLEYLLLEGNLLKALPDTIGGLTSLERLFLKGNNLEEIPECLGGVASLQTLWLSGSNLPEAEISRFKTRHPYIQVVYD